MAEARSTRRGPRPTAERFQRLMLMLPWLMERDEVLVAEMATTFQVSESELVHDLELAAMCGLPPFEDELIDLFIDEGPGGLTVYPGVGRLFTRALRLTAPEGFALLAAGRAALLMPGADPHGPLASALDKLEQRLGGRSVEVDGRTPPLAPDLTIAIERGAVLEIRYWSAWRDEVTERRIVPRLLFTDRGDWYLIADDERSGEERTFRVDRVESLTDTGEQVSTRHVDPPAADWFSGDTDLPTATLVLDADAVWVAERYPVRSSTKRVDGRLDVVLAVVSERWLARLLLRLGARAEVVDPPQWRDLGRRSAATVLARYRG